jgi:hypothetical protein
VTALADHQPAEPASEHKNRPQPQRAANVWGQVPNKARQVWSSPSGSRVRRFSISTERTSMSDDKHFIRSRSFSGWTHTLLVWRPTASPKKRHVGAARLTFDVDHHALEGPGFAREKLLSGERECA